MKKTIITYAATLFLTLSKWQEVSAQEMPEYCCDYSSLGYYDENNCDCSCEWGDKCCKILKNTVYVGPDIYHVKRIREGGTSQSGVLYGVRAGFDSVKRYCIYVGLEGGWAQGTLDGRNGSGTKLRSELTDSEVEGRVGYTFGTKNEWRFTFTPFVGGGYFCQNNNFRPPTPVSLHFRDSFTYVVAGFLSNVYLLPCLSTGLNFKTKFIYDGETRISNDPELGKARLIFGTRPHYEVDVPIAYHFSFWERDWSACLEPFFIFRHYGFHENFPFDFLDTKYYNWGARFLLGFQF